MNLTTFIGQLLPTVIACLVTFAASAQTFTDQTRAQGYFDFYSELLTNQQFEVTYYNQITQVFRSGEDIRVPSHQSDSLRQLDWNFIPIRGYYVSQSAMMYDDPDTARADGASYPRGYIRVTDEVERLFTTHLTGKVSSAELQRVTERFFDVDETLSWNVQDITTGESTSVTGRLHLDEPEIRIELIRNAQRAGATGEIPPTTLETLQSEVDRLTRELNNRPTQTQLDTAQAEVARLNSQLNDLPTQAQLDTANQELAKIRNDLSTAQARIAELEKQISRTMNPQATSQQPNPENLQTGQISSPPTTGGSSGGGAIAAVAVIGGLAYLLKRKKPDSTFQFAVMPTSNDSYVAEFNHSPKENLNINLRFTEDNLFKHNDIIKPETNTTAKLTVQWTW